MNLAREPEPDILTIFEEDASNEGENGREPIDSLTIEDRTEKLAKQETREDVVRVESDAELCTGKYIYIHHLPRKFNVDLLKNCRTLSEWTNMCLFTSNLGLGPHFTNEEKVYSNTGWFATNQFMLEVIFHNRMKQYKCLTNDSSLASAIFVPYYAGIDVARYLWASNPYLKDTDSSELVKWLKQKSEWKRMWGRDHFLVAGRITWDFRRLTDRVFDWGNKLLFLPETKNMTTLVIESSPWNNNDFAMPYPTYFHPSSDQEVFQWQNRMKRQKRRFLFSFAGGGRPNLSDSIRHEIMDQCRASRRKCRLLDCDPTTPNKCHKPVNVMKLFQNSVFCLQPPGDSFTRRSAFDSILAGCIPVFFHPGSAYAQYIWHLPKDYAKYSVFIPANEVKVGRISIERVLSRIAKEKVIAMREEVIRLIPRVIYADPRSTLKTLEDAFDITVNGVLERIETTRREMREGKNLTADFAEELSWKYNLFGTLGKHEWDPFFANKQDLITQ
ncbi:Exostosin domain-containing protein [Cephalotus follicularis]|uniref:Exostosin domain-containing protein n=1 Tax=Cephalotus follicularis TaxID=3775 RepID=A0A1Q3CDG3_CEPFO|nr:Exostosin domain-containing protein [Cephalotus follicularis]